MFYLYKKNIKKGSSWAIFPPHEEIYFQFNGKIIYAEYLTCFPQGYLVDIAGVFVIMQSGIKR